MTETKMQLVDWLDDLCVRFIINLPQEELESVERICFQVEEAQWFYEDFIRPLDPDLPSLNLRNFCLRIFQHCPLLSEFSSYHHSTAFSEFLAYKTRVPVRGAIMINKEMDAVVLVKGWKKAASWSFPRGKINKDEHDLDCAVREVYEETGYDIREAGLIGRQEDMKHIDVTMREQHMRLYVFRGVPTETVFEPRTRKEISKIQWYKLSELPTLKKKKNQQENRGQDLAINANRFYMVAPFLTPLKHWISQQKKLDKVKCLENPHVASVTTPGTHLTVNDDHTANETNGSPPEGLERLLTNLRRSGQAPSMSELPKMSEPLGQTHDASTHLKNLLHVAPDAHLEAGLQSPTLAANTVATDGKNANALLALIKGNGAIRGPPPETHLDRMVEPSVNPRSLPHYNDVHSQHVTAVPPVSFLAYPTPHGHQGNVHTGNYHPDIGLRGPATDLVTQPFIHRPSPSATHSPIQPNYSPSYTTAFHPSNRFRQVQAPYQRTGDPEFGRNLHIADGQTSLIPSASKLPPPKLTTHSSGLLSIFKSKKPITPMEVGHPPDASSIHSTTNSRFADPHENPEMFPLTEQPNGRDVQYAGDRVTHMPTGFSAVSPLTEQSNERAVADNSTYGPSPLGTLNQHKIQKIAQAPPGLFDESVKLAAWDNFHVTSRNEDSEKRRRVAEEPKVRLADEARTGVRHEAHLPAMRETWRLVEVDKQANQRNIIRVEKPLPPAQQQNTASLKESAVSMNATSGIETLVSNTKDEHLGSLTQIPVLGYPTDPVITLGQKYPKTASINPQKSSITRTDQQNTLLDLFRQPSVSKVDAEKPTAASLKPPTTPVELSALPSPSHSREPSKTEKQVPHPQPQKLTNGRIKTQKRSQDKRAFGKLPVSATVNGPLNVPQFNVIAKKSKGSVRSAEKSGTEQVQKRSPFTILARPVSIQGPQEMTQCGSSAFTEKPTTASIATLASAVQHEAKGTAPVSFHPRILRRPPQADLSAQVSAVSPSAGALKSSSQHTPFDRRPSQPQDQKKTLLSLFNNASVTANATAFPAPTANPLVDSASDQAGNRIFTPLPMSASRAGSGASAIGEKDVKSNSQVQTPRTPIDKKFFLGYLEGVANEEFR